MANEPVGFSFCSVSHFACSKNRIESRASRPFRGSTDCGKLLDPFFLPSLLNFVNFDQRLALMHRRWLRKTTEREKRHVPGHLLSSVVVAEATERPPAPISRPPPFGGLWLAPAATNQRRSPLGDPVPSSPLIRPSPAPQLGAPPVPVDALPP